MQYLRIRKIWQATMLLVLLVLVFIYYKLDSQTFVQFSGNPDKFTKEVKEFCAKAIADKKVLEKECQQFIILWDSSKIDMPKKKIIIEISKYLVERKARPVPDYFEFIQTILYFYQYNHPSSSFEEWLNGIYNYTGQRITIGNFTKVIQNTKLLLLQHLLYKSPAITWRTSDTSFVFRSFNSGLYAVFRQVNLICYANRDSSIIFQTSGKYNLLNNNWLGSDGLVTWEKAGFHRDTVNAKLTDYRINLSQTGYRIDSVWFTNKLYFAKPMLGVLENNVEYFINLNLLQYPQFESYQKSFFIRNFYKGVDYRGGFAMIGAKLAGKGSVEWPAMLTFFRNDTLRVRSTSLMYIFRPEKVVSSDASITIYLETDSIHHAALQFNYTVQNRELSLLKSIRYTARSPYLNSYHKIDMNFDQLLWRIDEPFIYFTYAPGGSRSLAIFESFNYFKREEFEALQYHDEQHPLVLLKKFSVYFNNDRTLSAKDFANFIRKSLDNVHTLLFPLTLKGYLLYDVSTETIHLKDKLFDALKASIGKIDYDVLKFYSVTEAPVHNARLDLRTNDLTINGIPQVFVSDSQNVAIIPTKSQIIMKRNRCFQFDGVVKAGLFTYFGKQFYFNYDSFKIVLRDVDSIRLKVIVGYDLAQKPIYQDVSNTINDATGEVLVDDPSNKSGVVNYPQYPIFRSYGYSYVYYDDPNIFNGVYKRERNFYFKIKPYEIDSLDNFTKESMRFAGIFQSADIFPEIEESLTLQKDFSLGFFHKTGSSGISLYKEKGIFVDTIHLSNQGLRGRGKFKYLTAEVSSKNIFFFPDSTYTIARNFSIGEQTTPQHSYPRVWGTNIEVRWYPYADDLRTKSQGNDYGIYNDQTTFRGQLNYTPKYLKGSGMIDMTSAYADSREFVFAQTLFKTDTANFRFRAVGSNELALSTDNVKATIDFARQFGTFAFNNPVATTELPTNKYITKISEMKWWMDKKEIGLLSKQVQEVEQEGAKFGFRDEPLTGAKYISVKKGQDSLNFVSPEAILNYANKTLTATKVKYIDVADARIFIKNEKLVVETDARIQPIENSVIMANRTTRFHRIYNANVSVSGKFQYSGKGLYDYIDENNKKQTITFTSISVDTSKQTIAQGEILESDSFTINPFFRYQGDVYFEAARKYLLFDGAAGIFANCPNHQTSWVKFEAVIDPVKVLIPISTKPIDLNRNPVVAGMLMGYDSIHIYSNFFARKKYVDDAVLATADGYLWYNKTYQAYEVADEKKLKRHGLPGKLVAFSPSDCRQYAEGPLNLNVNFDQLKSWFAGSMDHDLNANRIKLRLTMALDFYFYQPSLHIFANAIDSLGKDTIDISQPYFKKNLANLIDNDSIKLYFQQLADTSKDKKVVLPSLFRKTIFIDDVNLVYDDTTNSYKSVGKIGIGFIAGKTIHKKVDGYIEIWRKNSGDMIDIYLAPDNNTFYYFGYTPGKMQVLSSDKKFQYPIHDLPERQRRLKVPRGQKPYLFTIATDKKVSSVLKRWKTGINEKHEEFEQIIYPENELNEEDSGTSNGVSQETK